MLALWRCLNPLSNKTAVSLPAPPPAPQQCLIALSVRSGFDLLLSEQDWPVNSEIIFTGLTIPDMPRIAREHGYHPIGIDLDISNLEPAIDEIQRLVTPRTKAIVVAHLLGGRLPTNEISLIAKNMTCSFLKTLPSLTKVRSFYRATWRCLVLAPLKRTPH